MDKWLRKSQKKPASSEQDPSQSIPGRLPSPLNQRAPSPARFWDCNQEYSPSQSPIPSPQFHYSHNTSPLPSPGYSICPSPSPFPSTCPSPSLSPRHSPIPSPAPNVCPSPHGSPPASRSPSPITRGLPKSPCPSPPAPSRVRHNPAVHSQNQTQPNQTISPRRPKVRSWLAPAPKIDNKSKLPISTCPQQTHRHGPKAQTTENQSQSKGKALNSKHNHSHKSRPKASLHPGSKEPSEAPKANHTPHLEKIQSGRSNLKSRTLFQSGSRQSPTRAKHSAAPSRDINTSRGSCSQSASTAVVNSNTGLNSRSNTSLKPRAKSWEATAPTPAHVNHTKSTEKKPQSKQQEVEHRRDHQGKVERRKQQKREDRHREKQAGKQERKDERRLAEEQLLRRPWIQSSTEEEEEEEEEKVSVAQRQRKGEETVRGENSQRSEEQHRREWKSAQSSLQDASHRQGRAEKGGRSEEGRDPSPPPSHLPAPQRPSPSSNSDSESEYQAPINKGPSDSTSHKSLTKRRQQGTGEADRPKVVPPRGQQREGQQTEVKQKLYTLVPFGRGDHSTASYQRGLRNLVVQINLCLLKRVPESTTSPTVKTPSSSSVSSSTKNKEREMKHLFAPDTVAKDGKRKRKVDTLCIYFPSLFSLTHVSINLGKRRVLQRMRVCVFVCD